MKKLGIYKSVIDYYHRFNRNTSSKVNSITKDTNLKDDLIGIYKLINFIFINKRKSEINLNFLSKPNVYDELCKSSSEYQENACNVYVQTGTGNYEDGGLFFINYSSLYRIVYLLLPFFTIASVFAALKNARYVKKVGVKKSIIRYAVFLSKSFVFSKLIKVSRAKVIHLVDSYSTNQAINFAGKSLGIKVIELQHGIISKGHLGYNRDYLDDRFYPDKMVVLSDKFIPHIGILRLGSVNYEVTPLDYFKSLKLEADNAEPAIVIIGQPSISENLRELYQRLESQGGNVFYKPHPRENTELLMTFNLYKKSTWDRNHKYIGGFSTLLIELSESGCKEITALSDFIPEHYDEVLIEFGINLKSLDSFIKS